jgi:hypothetical protein
LSSGSRLNTNLIKKERSLLCIEEPTRTSPSSINGNVANWLTDLRQTVTLEQSSYSRFPEFPQRSHSPHLASPHCGGQILVVMRPAQRSSQMDKPLNRCVMHTESQVAEYLGVSVGTVRRWRLSGGGPRWVRVGASSIRYRVHDLEAYVAGLPSGGGNDVGSPSTPVEARK